MEPWIWGPDFWLLLFEILRACGAAHRDAVLCVLYLMRWVLPCVKCRAHLNQHYATMDPASAPDLIEWVWQLKNRVNESQGRPPSLTLPAFCRRLESTAQLLSPERAWDLFLVLALNYPLADQHQADAEALVKRHAYDLWLVAVHRCLQNVPHLRDLFSIKRIMARSKGAPALVTYERLMRTNMPPISAADLARGTIPMASADGAMLVPPQCVGHFAWRDRENAFLWILKQKRKWEERTGVASEQRKLNRKFENRLIEVVRSSAT